MYDYCRRICRKEAGGSKWLMIPRGRCNNPACHRIHRMLPDFLAPYKHYASTLIGDALDGKVNPADSDFRPSVQTVCRWFMWLEQNTNNINGYLKSIAYRELGFSEELLKSGVSLLDEIRSSMVGWLEKILTIIYNAGGFLEPCHA